MIDTATFTKLVAATIPASPNPPKLLSEIAEEVGDTESRVKSAIARIKDEYPGLPLTSSNQGYLWSRERDDVRRHARKEVGYVSTRTRRSLLDGLLTPYYESCGADQVDRARQRIQFILDDLAQIAQSVDGPRAVKDAA